MNDSEQELLKAWLEAAGADGPDRDYMHRERREFFRVLRKVKAEAWDEAIDEAMGQGTIQVPPNPYDEEEGTVSTWSERAHRSAEALDMEALLSDEVVERAARALYAEDVNESMDTPWPDYDSPQNLGRPLYEERARNALTAAIGGDDE